MRRYRIHRMKDAPRENFRWAPHTGGLAIVKSKDYDPADEIYAANPYESWKLMMERGHPLRPGDLLELVDGSEPLPAGIGVLQIVKYIGFEPAQWFVPEPKPAPSPTPSESASSGSSQPETRDAFAVAEDYESNIPS
jgi:hypothetical protein